MSLDAASIEVEKKNTHYEKVTVKNLFINYLQLNKENLKVKMKQFSYMNGNFGKEKSTCL